MHIFIFFSDISNDKESNVAVDDSSQNKMDEMDENTSNQVFCQQLRQWAVDHAINRMALKDLLKIIKDSFKKGKPFLPEDPRTFLQTPQIDEVVPVNNGG